MVKMTFTLDDVTVARLRRSAERTAKPQSQIIREAIGDYADRLGRLSDAERRRMLEVFDALVPAIPLRPAKETAAEIRAVRAARRAGGRRHRSA
jgi:predicted transcriptional regulator